MKNKSLFLVLVILCLTSVEIYSSRQELKFDAPLPSNTENGNARSDYGPPGEGDGSWYFGGSGCVKFSQMYIKILLYQIYFDSLFKNL